MPVAVGVAVVAWTGSALAGAIATAAVTWAIIGGTIGAVTAIVSGGDILKGTLKGALIGGVVGGVTGGIGHLLTGTTAGAAAGAGGGDALAVGLTPGQYAAIGDTGLSAAAADVSVSAGATGGLLEGGGPFVPAAAPVTPGAAPVVSQASAAPLSSAAQVAKIMEQSRMDQMIMGGVQGLATSTGTVLAGKDKAESDKELADALAAREDAKKAGNLAGDYQSLFREYTLPGNWIRSTENLYDKYRNKGAPAAGSGLLAGGVA